MELVGILVSFSQSIFFKEVNKMFSTPMSNLGSNMIALAIGAAIVLCSQMYAKYKSEKAVEAAAAAAATTTAKE